MLTFLTTGAGVILVNWLTSFVKSYIMPRWGGLGVHVFSFAVALVLAAGYQLYSYDGVSTLDFKGWVESAGTVYASAVVLYETLIKRFL